MKKRTAKKAAVLRRRTAPDSPVAVNGKTATPGAVSNAAPRTLTEQEIDEIRRRYRALAENKLVCMYVHDFQGNFIDANQAALDLFGISREDIGRYNIAAVLADRESLEIAQSGIKLLLAGLPGRPPNVYRLRTAQGGERYVEASASLITRDGTPHAVMGIARDITERRRAEQALQQSEEFSRTIIENSPIGFAVRNKQGQLLMYNKAWVKIWAMTPDRIARHTRAITDDNFASLFAHLGPYLEQVKKIFASGGSLFIPELRIDSPHPGAARWIRQYFYTINSQQGEVERIVALTDDISERKTADERLRESEQLFKTLARISPVGIFRTDAGGATTYVNPQWCQISGLSQPEAMGDGWLRAVHPDDRDKIRDGWAAAVARQDATTAEYRFCRPDGTTSWVMGQAIPEQDDQGRVAGYVGTITDISERKKTEEQLRESEINYRQIFDGIVEGIYRTTVDGTILMANPALIRMLGYDNLEDLMRINVAREGYMDAAHRQRFQELMQRDGRVWGFQSQWRRKDGSVITISENARAVRAPDGTVLCYDGTVEDITEHIKADLALLDEKNKLAQLFQVSLSVARAGSIQQQLDLTMQGLAELRLFNRMVLIIKDDEGRNTHVAQTGLTEAETELIKNAAPAAADAKAKILNPKYRFSNSYFIPHDDREVQQALSFSIPARSQTPGEWNPADNLLVPMMVKEKIIGYLSVDDPVDGRIPPLEIVRLLELYANQAAIAIDNMRLYQDLEQSYYDTLKAFVAAMEAKDPYTKGHSQNVQRYALKIARHLGLTEDRIRLINFSSLLHDIGKMAIKEDILVKPAALSVCEYEEVKQHPVIGSLMVAAIENLSVTGPIIRAHHEYYDGTGYPGGIKGEHIPLESRIISVADAFEAMTSDRPYRKAFGRREALQRLEQASGTQFDCAVVNALVEVTLREGTADDPA